MERLNGMKKVLVIAHDAGGAEIVAAFVKAHRRKQAFEVFVSGPATRIFSREHIRHRNLPKTALGIRKLFASHRDAAYLLAGTGGPRSIELVAMKEAKRAGLRTCAYIDSWSFYRERFGYPDPRWRQNIPDEIWTGDAAATRLAKRYFPHRLLRKVPDLYFKDALRRFKALRNRGGRSVLFMSASDWGEAQKSEPLLAAVLSSLARTPSPPPIRIRRHPLDASSRYRAILRRYPKLSVSFSQEKDIVNDIARTRIAIGASTTALVVSALLGVPAIRVTPQQLPAVSQKLFHARNQRLAVRKLLRLCF
jgi:hypothetical protein